MWVFPLLAEAQFIKIVFKIRKYEEGTKMSVMEIQKNGLAVRLNDETGKIRCALASGLAFETLDMPDEMKMENARIEGGEIRFFLLSNGLRLKGRIGIENDCAAVRLQGEGAFQGVVHYPPDFDAVPGDVALMTVTQGFAFPVDDPDVEIRTPERVGYGSDTSMFFAGQLRGEGWLVAAAEKAFDAVLYTRRHDDGIIRSGIGWIPEKGQWGYERAVLIMMGETGGMTSAMKRYRRLRQQQGMAVSLWEKRKKNPQMDRLVGAANVWMWHKNGMNALYSEEDREWEVDNGENIRRVIPEMKALGMDDILWGIFFREDCQYAREIKEKYGFLPTHYEIYRDTIPKPEAHLITPTRLKRNHMIDGWPDEITVAADGSLLKCWPIKGKDGQFHYENAACDIMALRRCMNRVPEDKKRYGWEARFIDVLGGGLDECYHPDHGMTRTDSSRYRCALLGFLMDYGMLSGTEQIHEDYLPYTAYNEGNMSPQKYRMPDAGRRMATVLRGDEIPESVDRYILNPKYRAPLWELAFHDCMVSYWYWGDSAVSCPERIGVRDLFCQLYGQPEMYSFSVENWDELKDLIAASYHRTHGVAKQVGYEEMLSFSYLTKDLLVQKTEFESLSVTANFGSVPYTCPDGTVIPAGESRIEKKEKAHE